MDATGKDLENLLLLQEADIARLNAEKKLDALPQRSQLQELADKKRAVLGKAEQVAKLRDAAHRKLTQVEDETAILGRKRDETQEKIEAASGDFRAVQSLTRDLEGIAKRLDALESEQLAASERLEQVESVKDQAEQALSALDSQALQLRESFQRDAGELKETIREATSRREGIAGDMDRDILQAYAEARRRGGGVGVARLEEGRCGTCRSTIDPNRLLIVKREAPLSHCPSCGRLLIV